MPLFEDKIDIGEWHLGNLRAVPKQGVMSSILTKCLQIVLQDVGYPIQFGSNPRTGCPNSKFLMKNNMQLRCGYDHDSYLVFLDLEKAFDTVDHKLLFCLLGKYGIPDNVIRTIRKLYSDFKMTLKIGNEKETIDYLTGVTQGDVLAPTLFIFPM